MFPTRSTGLGVTTQNFLVLSGTDPGWHHSHVAHYKSVLKIWSCWHYIATQCLLSADGLVPSGQSSQSIPLLANFSLHVHEVTINLTHCLLWESGLSPSGHGSHWWQFPLFELMIWLSNGQVLSIQACLSGLPIYQYGQSSQTYLSLGLYLWVQVHTSGILSQILWYGSATCPGGHCSQAWQVWYGPMMKFYPGQVCGKHWVLSSDEMYLSPHGMHDHEFTSNYWVHEHGGLGNY